MTRNSEKTRDMQMHANGQTFKDVSQLPWNSALQWQQPSSELWARQTALEDQISLQAYQRFIARGGEVGHDVEDWLKAEREVLKRGTTSSTE
jgi:hypothetical protein